MGNRKETINSLLDMLNEVTTKQFFVSTINLCLKNIGITKMILMLTDLDLLNDDTLNKLLIELNRIYQVQLKEMTRRPIKGFQKGLFGDGGA